MNSPRFSSLAFLAAVAAAACALLSCRSSGSEVFRIAFVSDAGGLGDKARNDLLWRACQRFVEEGPRAGAQIDFRSPLTKEEGDAALRELCGAAPDVMLVASPVWEDEVFALAKRYPRSVFIVADGRRGAKNVRAISFPSRDVGYLMGVAAAASVPGGGYGFLGGRDDAATVALAGGFVAGVRSEIPEAKVDVRYLGSDFAAPTRLAAARATAGAMYRDGAGVLFCAAGPANVEIAVVAKEHEKLVIGYESNQNYLERGYVVTSLSLRWDDVVFQELMNVASGRFVGGKEEIPITSALICYPVDDNNRRLIPSEAVEKIEAARQRLAAARTP